MATRAADRTTTLRPPTPAGGLVTGQLRQRRADPLGLFLDSRRDLGDVVRYRMLTLPVYQFTHPDQVGQILLDNADRFSKGAIWAKTRPLIGAGLITTEGDQWREQRRMAQPAFHDNKLAALGDLVAETVTDHLDRWRRPVADHEVLPVFPELCELTLTLVLRVLFGLPAGRDDRVVRARAAFPTALQVTNRRVSSPLPYAPRLYRWPTPGNRRFDAARTELDAVVTDLIADRQAQADAARAGHSAAGAGVDLLGLLIEAFDTRDTAADRRLLRDQVLTLLLAGFETTAVTLGWALLLLDEHPDEAERVGDEVDTVLAGRVPSAADCARLPRLRAVVDETLRLYPPVWAVPRTAEVDCVLGGYHVPARSVLVLSPYVTHRHPDFWTQPESFVPDRWVREPSAGRQHRFAYLPFGGGKRRCLGNHLAIMESMITLAMIIQRYRWHRVGPTVRPDPSVTLRPRGEVPMRLTARS